MRNRPENQITLVLIRHGATRANREHRYLGKTDEGLSPEGKTQLAEYRRLQCYPSLDLLFVSPMKRCIQTAEILYPGMRPVVVEEWEEMDFGAFEGKNYMELREDGRYQAWIDSSGTLPFPEGECREEFLERCCRGFRRMAGEVKRAEDGKAPARVGLIVHGGTIMALLSSYGGGDYFDYQADNGRGYVCTLRNSEGAPKITDIGAL